MTTIKEIRDDYHRAISQKILFNNSEGVPNNADKHSRLSVSLAKGIINKWKFPLKTSRPTGQASGRIFEQVTKDFLKKSFKKLSHLRPGKWSFSIGKKIEEFEQYEHLYGIAKTLNDHKELRAAFGDYLISPDIVIGRLPVTDAEIDKKETLLDDSGIVKHTPIRAVNSSNPILHASISCKWTIRSDRAQNVRTEGLNLIRNRKGKTPHIVIVTAEPYPQRISSLALGTGDIDCVYHFALPELQNAAKEEGNPAVIEMLDIMISGKRMRDISDLPFDLAI